MFVHVDISCIQFSSVQARNRTSGLTPFVDVLLVYEVADKYTWLGSAGTHEAA